MANLFAINGTFLWPPDGYQEAPMPIIGYNLKGEPVRQGYPGIIFTWSFMNQDHLAALLDAYPPTNPQVQVSYIEAATGTVITQYGMMEEPIIGARFIVYYQNVACRISRLTDTL